MKLGEDADAYVVVPGHYGNKSKLYAGLRKILVLSISVLGNKQEFNEVYERFLTQKITQRPMLLKVFTDSIEESAALEAMLSIARRDKQCQTACQTGFRSKRG